jgi:hypothetical protein
VKALPLLLLLLLLCAAAPLAAQAPPRLEVALKPVGATGETPAGITVGDPVEAVLTLSASSLAADPRFPVWGATWGDAEVLEKGAPEKVGETGGASGRVTWRQRIVVAAYRTGKIDLPPVQVAVPLRDRTLQAESPAGLAFEVRSVLPPSAPGTPGDKELTPKPPAALRPLPIGAAFWWTLAGMSALCAFLYWMLWRQSRRRLAAGEAEKPPLPAYEELIGTLDALGAEPSMLRLHTRLSLALRHYLARALSVPAPESTTSEVHRLLLARRLPGPIVRQTVELLRACDLVKFARQEVGETLGRERVAAARRIAADLDRRMRPIESPETPETPARLEAAG